MYGRMYVYMLGYPADPPGMTMELMMLLPRRVGAGPCDVLSAFIHTYIHSQPVSTYARTYVCKGLIYKYRELLCDDGGLLDRGAQNQVTRPNINWRKLSMLCNVCNVCMAGGKLLLDKCVGVSRKFVHVLLDESVRGINHRTREVKNAKFIILKVYVCMYVNEKLY